jgi:hypothetical protein
MGGFNSGWYRDGKQTTSDYKWLDVRQCQKRGYLVVGGSFSFGEWDAEVITNRKRDEPNMLCLSRRARGQDRREQRRIWIEWSGCHYGGKRAWFLCPTGCGRRAAILYYRDSTSLQALFPAYVRKPAAIPQESCVARRGVDTKTIRWIWLPDRPFSSETQGDAREDISTAARESAGARAIFMGWVRSTVKET